tara:strand:- start:1825 stop:20529 length:18705 start_codon:yes stop_codon:yes gene_type:complete
MNSLLEDTLNSPFDSETSSANFEERVKERARDIEMQPAGSPRRKELEQQLDFNRTLGKRILDLQEGASKGSSGRRWGASRHLDNFKTWASSDMGEEATDAYKANSDFISGEVNARNELHSDLMSEHGNFSILIPTHTDRVKGLRMEPSDPETADMKLWASNQERADRLLGFVDAPDGKNKFDYEGFKKRTELPKYDSLFSKREIDPETGMLLPRNEKEVSDFYDEKNWEIRMDELHEDAPDKAKFNRNGFTGVIKASSKFFGHSTEKAQTFVDEAVKNGDVSVKEGHQLMKDQALYGDKIIKANAQIIFDGASDERGRDLAKLDAQLHLDDFYDPLMGDRADDDFQTPIRSLTSELDIKRAGGASPREIKDTWGKITPAFMDGFKEIVDTQGGFEATLSLGAKKFHQGYMDIGYGLGNMTGLVSDETVITEFDARAARKGIEDMSGGNEFWAEAIGIAPSLAISMGGGAVLSAAGKGISKLLVKGLVKTAKGRTLVKATQTAMSKSLEKTFAGRVAGFVAKRGGSVGGSAVAGGVESGAKTYAAMRAERTQDGELRYNDEEIAAGARTAFYTTTAVTWVLGPSGKEAIFGKHKTLNSFKAAMLKDGRGTQLGKALWAATVEGGKDIIMEGVEEFSDEFIQGIWQSYDDGELFVNGKFNYEKFGEILEGAWLAFRLGAVAGGIGAQSSSRGKFKQVRDNYTKAFNETADAKTFNKAQYTPEMRASLASLSGEENVSESTEVAMEAIHARLEESRMEVAKAAGIAPEGIEGTELALSQARAQHSADEALEQAERQAFESNPDYESVKVHDLLDPEAAKNVSAAEQKALRMVNYAALNTAASKVRLSEAEAAHAGEKVKAKEAKVKEAKAAKLAKKAEKAKAAPKVDTPTPKVLPEAPAKTPTSERSADNTTQKVKAEVAQKVRTMKDSDGKEAKVSGSNAEHTAQAKLQEHEGNNEGTSLRQKLTKLSRNVLPIYTTGTTIAPPLSKGEAIKLLNEADADLQTLHNRKGDTALDPKFIKALRTRLDNIENIIKDMYDHDGGGTRTKVGAEHRAAFDAHVAALNRESSVKRVKVVLGEKAPETTKPDPVKKPAKKPVKKAPEKEAPKKKVELTDEGIITIDGVAVTIPAIVKPEPTPEAPAQEVEPTAEELRSEPTEEPESPTEAPKPKAEAKESFDEKRRRIQAEVDRQFAIEARLTPIINAVASGKSIQEAVQGAYTGSYSIEEMTNRTFDVHDSLAFAASFARDIAESKVATDIEFDGKMIDLTKLSGQGLYDLYMKKMGSLTEAPKVDDPDLNSLIGFITYQQAVIDIKLNSKQLSSTDLHRDIRKQLDSPLNDIGRIKKASGIIDEMKKVDTSTDAGKKKMSGFGVSLVKLITSERLGIDIGFNADLDSDSKFAVVGKDKAKKIYFRSSLFNKIHKIRGKKKLTDAQKEANAYEALRILEHEILHVAAYEAVGVDGLALIGQRALSSPQMMSYIAEYGTKDSDLEYFKGVVKLDSEGKPVSGKDAKITTIGKGGELDQDGLVRLGFEVLALYGQEVRTGTHSSRSLAASHELNAAQGIIAPVFDSVAKAKRDLLHVDQRVNDAIDSAEAGVESKVVPVEFEQNTPADTDSSVFAPNMAKDILTDLDVEIVDDLRKIDRHMNVKFGWKPVLAEHLGLNEGEGTIAGVSILGTFDQRANNPLAAPSDEFLMAMPNQDGDSVDMLKKQHRKNAKLWERGDKKDISFVAAARLVNASLIDLQNNLDKFIATKDGESQYKPEGMEWMRDYSQKQDNFAKLAAKDQDTLTDNGKALNKVLSKVQKKARAVFKKAFGKEVAKGSDYVTPVESDGTTDAESNLMAAVKVISEANQFVVRTVGGKGRMNVTLAKYNPLTHEFELNYNPELLPRDTDGKLLRTAKGAVMPNLTNLNEAINELNEAGYVEGVYTNFTDARDGFDDSATDLHNAILSELSDDAFVEGAFDSLGSQASERHEARRQVTKGANMFSSQDRDVEEKRNVLKNLLGDTSEGSFFRGMSGEQIINVIKGIPDGDGNRMFGFPDFEGKDTFNAFHDNYLDSIKKMAELESLLIGINSDEDYDADTDVRNLDFTNTYNAYADSKNEITREVGVIAPLLGADALRQGMLRKNLGSGEYHLSVSQGHALMAERALAFIYGKHASDIDEKKLTKITSGLEALVVKAGMDADQALSDKVDVRSPEDMAEYQRVVDKASESDLRDFMNLFSADGAYDINRKMFIIMGEAHDFDAYDSNSPEWIAFRGQYTNPLVGKLQADIQAVYDDEGLVELDKVHLERGDILYLVLGPEAEGAQKFNKRSNAQPLQSLAMASAIGMSGRSVSDIGRRLPLPVPITEENRSRHDFNQDYIPRLKALFETLNTRLQDKKLIKGKLRNDSYAYKLEQTPLFSYQTAVLKEADSLQALIDKYGITSAHFEEDGTPVMADDDTSQLEVDFREMFTDKEATFDLVDIARSYKMKIASLQKVVKSMNGGIDMGVAPLMRYSKPFTQIEKLQDIKNGRDVVSGGIENAMKQVERMVPKLADPNYNLRGRHVRSPEAFEDELATPPVPIEYDENGLAITSKKDDFKAGETPSARRERGKNPEASNTEEVSIYSAYDVNESVDLDNTGYGLGAKESAEHDANQKQRAIHYMYNFLYTDGDPSYNLDTAVDVLNKMVFSKPSKKQLTSGRTAEEIEASEFTNEFGVTTENVVVPKYNVDTMMDADPDLLMSAMHEVMLDALNKNRVLKNAQKIAGIANIVGTTSIFGANGSGTVHQSDWGTVHDDSLTEGSDKTTAFDSYVETLVQHADVLRNRNSGIPDPVVSKGIDDSINRVGTDDFGRKDETNIATNSQAHKKVGKMLVSLGFKRGHPIHDAATNSTPLTQTDINQILYDEPEARDNIEDMGKLIFASNQSAQLYYKTALELNVAKKAIEELKNVEEKHRSAFGRHLEVSPAVAETTTETKPDAIAAEKLAEFGDEPLGGEEKKAASDKAERDAKKPKFKGKAEKVKARPAVNEFYELMANAALLPEKDVKLITAGEMLKNRIYTQAGGTARGLSLLSNLISTGLENVPVIVHNGAKAPKHLQFKNTSGVVVDDAGDVVAIFLNTDASVGKAGLSTGIESIIHDLTEIQLSKNLDSMNTNQKKKIKQLKKQLDEQYLHGAKRDYVKRGHMLFNRIIKERGIEQKDGSYSIAYAYDETHPQYPNKDDYDHDSRYEEAVEQFAKDHFGSYTVDLNDPFVQRELRAEIGRLHDSALPLNAEELLKISGQSLDTASHKKTFTKTNATKPLTTTKSVLPVPDFINTRGLTDAELNGIIKGNDVILQKGKNASDVEGLQITGNPELPVKLVYKQGNAKIINLQGSRPVILINLKDDVSIKKMLLARHPDTKIEDIPLVGEDLVEAISIRSGQNKAKWRDRAARANSQSEVIYTETTSKDETVVGQAGNYFQNMSDVEFFSKVLFDTQVQMYLDKVGNFPAYDYISRKLTKSLSTEELAAAEVIKSDLSHHEEVAILDPNNTDFVESNSDVAETADTDFTEDKDRSSEEAIEAGLAKLEHLEDFDDLDATEGNDKKATLKGEVIKQLTPPVLINNEMGMRLGKDASIFDSLIKIGVGLVSKNASIAAHNLDQIKPSGTLGERGIHSAVGMAKQDSAPVTIDDILDGRADEIVKLDRMRNGRLGAYSDAEYDSVFGSGGNRYFREITSSPQNKMDFAKGVLLVEDKENISDDEVKMISILPKEGVISEDDYNKADKLLARDKKEFLDIKAHRQGLINDEIRMKKLELELNKENSVSLQEAYTAEQKKDIVDQMKASDAQAFLTENANHSKALRAQIAVLRARGITLDKRYVEADMRDEYAKMYWEERIRSKRQKRRSDPKNDPNNSPDIRRSEFVDNDPLFNYLRDSVERGEDFVMALDDVLAGRKFIDGNTYIHRPILDLDSRIRELRRAQYGMSDKDAAKENAVDDKGFSDPTYKQEIKGTAKDFTVHSGNDITDDVTNPVSRGVSMAFAGLGLYPDYRVVTEIDTDLLNVDYSLKNRLNQLKITKESHPSEVAWLSRNESSVDWSKVNTVKELKDFVRVRFIDRVQIGQYRLNADDSAASEKPYVDSLQRNAAGGDVNAESDLALYDKEGWRGLLKQRINPERIRAINEWTDYLTNGNELYGNDPFMRDIVFDIPENGIKSNKGYGLGRVPNLNKSVVAMMLQDIQAGDQKKISKIYEKTGIDMASSQAFDSLDIGEGKKWIKIPSKSEDSVNFEANVQKLKDLSSKAWCTKTGMARPYLKNGGFWVLIEDGATVATIRLQEGGSISDSIAEVRNAGNSSIEAAGEPYADEVSNLILEKKIDAPETAVRLSSDPKIITRLYDSDPLSAIHNQAAPAELLTRAWNDYKYILDLDTQLDSLSNKEHYDNQIFHSIVRHQNLPPSVVSEMVNIATEAISNYDGLVPSFAPIEGWVDALVESKNITKPQASKLAGAALSQGRSKAIRNVRLIANKSVSLADSLSLYEQMPKGGKDPNFTVTSIYHIHSKQGKNPDINLLTDLLVDMAKSENGSLLRALQKSRYYYRDNRGILEKGSHVVYAKAALRAAVILKDKKTMPLSSLLGDESFTSLDAFNLAETEAGVTEEDRFGVLISSAYSGRAANVGDETALNNAIAREVPSLLAKYSDSEGKLEKDFSGSYAHLTNISNVSASQVANELIIKTGLFSDISDSEVIDVAHSWSKIKGFGSDWVLSQALSGRSLSSKNLDELIKPYLGYSNSVSNVHLDVLRQANLSNELVSKFLEGFENKTFPIDRERLLANANIKNWSESNKVRRAKVLKRGNRGDAEMDALIDANSNVEGYYDPTKDEMVFNASAIHTEERARELAFHEVTHRNIHLLSTDDKGRSELAWIMKGAENVLMRNLPSLLKATGHTNLAELKSDYGFNNKDGDVAVQYELLARYAEKLGNKKAPTWFSEIMSELRLWLNKNLGLRLSDEALLHWLKNDAMSASRTIPHTKPDTSLPDAADIDHPLFSKKKSAPIAPVKIKTSLLTEFGMETDTVLATKMRERTLSGLEGKNDNYSQLSPDSAVRASVEGMIGIIADFAGSKHASDADFDTAIDLLSKAEIGDLHGFMKDGAYFVSKAMGTFFMSSSTQGVNYKFKGLQGELSMHRDAKLKAFMAKDRPLYEMMVGVLDILEQGLGTKGGRNKAHIDNKAADKRIKAAIKKSSHKAANEAYVSTLITRVVPDLVVRTTNEEGDVEVLELTIREQIQNNIDHVKKGYDYQDVEHSAEVKHLSEFTESVPAVIQKAQDYLDNSTEDDLIKDDNGEGTVFEQKMREGLEKGMEAVKVVQDELAKLNSDTKVLGEALGENQNSFVNLNRDTKNFVPHLVVGASLGGSVDHSDKPMYKTLGGAVGRVFGHKDNAQALNLNLLSAAMSEVTKQQNLNNTAVEYQIIDNLFGYSSDPSKSFVTGMEAGADSFSDPLLQSSAKAISGFGQALARKQKVNDTRAAIIRGKLIRAAKLDAVFGYFGALFSIIQFGIQAGTGLAGQAFKNPMSILKMIDNIGRQTFTPFAYKRGNGFKQNVSDVFGGEARRDIKKMKEIGGAWFIDRAFNGVEEFERGVESLNHDDYTKIGLAFKYGGMALKGLPTTLLHIAVGLPDSMILSGVYATQLRLQTGLSLSEIAADPTGYTKEIAMARINTESIMAQSDLSKKSDAFQPKEKDWVEAARLLFIPFTNQKMSMAADTWAYIQVLNPLTKATEGARKEAVKGLVSNLGQQITYHAIKIKSASYIAPALVALVAELFDKDDEETVEERTQRYQDYLYSVLSGEKGLIPDYFAVLNKNDRGYSFDDWLGKMVHGILLDGVTLLHPALSLDPVTNTLGVGMQYGSDSLADANEWGKEMSYEPLYGDKKKGRSMNPRGKRYTKWEKIDGKWKMKRQHTGMAIASNFFAGSEAIHGLIPDLISIPVNMASATRDYQTDILNVDQIFGKLYNTRERNSNIEKEMNMRHFGTPYKPNNASMLNKDRGLPWFLSTKRPAPVGDLVRAPFEDTPQMVFDTKDTVFGDGEGYHKEVVSYKYNDLGDGDSGSYTNQPNFPLFYTTYRLYGTDTHEKAYKKRGYTAIQHQKHYEETGVTREMGEYMGNVATWHIDQLLHGKKVTLYVKKGKRDLDLNGRTKTFAMIEVDGKQVDQSIYLASKGLIMWRKNRDNRDLPDILPSGQSLSSYIKAFRAAEAHAEKNKLGMFSLGTRAELMETKSRKEAVSDFDYGL